MSKIKLSDDNLGTRAFRNVFLVEDRDFWASCPFPYDEKKDLVLTFDFGLFKLIKKLNGPVAFLDHIVDRQTVEKYNYAVYGFLADWFKDKVGKDIFIYKDIKFGNAFRLEIWNDATYHCRVALNLLALKALNFSEVYVGMNDPVTSKLIKELGFKAHYWQRREVRHKNYYFPVFRWMRERIYPSRISLGQLIKIVLTFYLDLANRLRDFFEKNNQNISYIFALSYFPTVKIIEQLKLDSKLRVVLPDYSWSKGLLKEKRLPIAGFSFLYRKQAAAILRDFNHRRSAQIFIDEFDLSKTLYGIFLKRISKTLPNYLNIIESIRRFFGNRNLKLMINFSNIGIVNSLMSDYCRRNDIPTYLVINGWLGNSYLDEAKDATWINSYGESVKLNYFRNMNNIVCLGDPRMDAYVGHSREKKMDRTCPTIVIGAAGFCNIDLNSYLAFEFDFLDDILATCVKLRKTGKEMNLIIKVRSNGYIDQYVNFVKEYYPDLPIEIYDSIPMAQLLDRADFYISIYSQTLFEASSLDIPALYYKKDTEYLDPPFDGKAELVTARNLAELEEKIEAFYADDAIYNTFEKKDVMEKYIGPLDGNNLKRNMDFIYSLIYRGGLR